MISYEYLEENKVLNTDFGTNIGIIQMPKYFNKKIKQIGPEHIFIKVLLIKNN